MKKTQKPTQQPSGLITIRIVKLAATAAALFTASVSPAQTATTPTTTVGPATPARVSTGVGDPATSTPATRTVPATTGATTPEVTATADIRAETAYFVAVGERNRGGPESFIVPVSGAARISVIRQYLGERAAGTERRPLIPTCIVRLGNDGENRNHSAPGAPAWGWQVAEFVSARRAQPELEIYPAIPSIFASPSEIEQLLRDDPASLPDRTISLLSFPIVMELRSEFPRGALANFSDRGFVGPGQVKIMGFVIDGGSPRNVVVRVLGPSLAYFNVPGALANPRFELYRGAEKVADNDDWVDGNLNRPHIAVVPPPSPFHLVPFNKLEPALELTLAPGAYTVVVRGGDNDSGVALTEVHLL